MINVIIADHQAIFRAGIAKALAVEEDIRIVGQPRSSEQLLNAVKKLRARVLILSTSFLPLLPEIHAIEGGRNVALLMLVENSETASDFMRTGVQGAIYRCASADVLVEAVRQVSRGELFLQNRNIEADVREDLAGARIRDRLSDRELLIILAVVKGFKSHDFATQLCTSEQIVKNAVRKIFDKFGVSNRLELALFTIHHRILAEATASVPAPTHKDRERNPCPNWDCRDGSCDSQDLTAGIARANAEARPTSMESRFHLESRRARKLRRTPDADRAFAGAIRLPIY